MRYENKNPRINPLDTVRGKHSNLGSIDFQMDGLACQAVLNEFEQIKENSNKISTYPFFQSICIIKKLMLILQN